MLTALGVALFALIGLLAWWSIGEAVSPPVARLDADATEGAPEAFARKDGIASTPTSTAPEQLVEFEVAASTTSSATNAPLVGIRGSVVDERTGDAVPSILVSVVEGGTKAETTTNEVGQFELASSPTDEQVTLKVADLGVQIATRTRSRKELDAGHPWELSVPIGPTFRLDSPTEALDATWQVQVIEQEGAGEISGRLLVTSSGLEMAPRDEAPRRLWVPMNVRMGGVPWIRYPRSQYPPKERYQTLVRVSRAEPELELRGIAHAAIGIQTVIVARSDASGIVTGTILTQATGTGSTERATVVLMPLDDTESGAASTRMWHKCLGNADGVFHLRDVELGRWRMLAYAPSHRPKSTEFVLTPDGVDVGDVRLEHVPGGGVLRAGFTYEESPLFGDLFACVRFVGEGRSVQNWIGTGAWGYGVGWPADRPPELSIVLDGLPVSPLSMIQYACLRRPEWKPYALEFASPTSPIELASIDRAASQPFRFNVSDAETKSSLPSCIATFGPPGSFIAANWVREGTDGENSDGGDGTWRLPPDAPLAWFVWTPGYSPVGGDERSFVERGDERVADVRLEPGWGVVLRARIDERDLVPADIRDSRDTPIQYGPSHRLPSEKQFIRPIVEFLACPPAAGVAVFADDVHVGTTDLEGNLCAALPMRPHQLILRRNGLRLVELQHGLDGYTEFPEYVLWMKR